MRIPGHRADMVRAHRSSPLPLSSDHHSQCLVGKRYGSRVYIGVKTLLHYFIRLLKVPRRGHSRSAAFLNGPCTTHRTYRKTRQVQKASPRTLCLCEATAYDPVTLEISPYKLGATIVTRYLCLLLKSEYRSSQATCRSLYKPWQRVP